MSKKLLLTFFSIFTVINNKNNITKHYLIYYYDASFKYTYIDKNNNLLITNIYTYIKVIKISNKFQISQF